ncbi:7 transmembrane sweet-taste receptor of 3 GCPR domain containing protein [Nitzschia inconspicua]|uniref:7 transmembrane sweet-taste receptor of 3 GCPR domain containing protein n=1 Tax=Nitzschia inconspicua TaxID=303405 RepID=A0A9K3LFF1_9STRA|nr:7 transmembrane sweet-taste receptor of 3 GCPR domain containing protein [Nitzschia inconspicua]
MNNKNIRYMESHKKIERRDRMKRKYSGRIYTGSLMIGSLVVFFLSVVPVTAQSTHDAVPSDNTSSHQFPIYNLQNVQTSSRDSLLISMTSSNGVWRLLEETTQNSTQNNATPPPVEVYRSKASLITAMTLGSVAVVSCAISWLFLFQNRKKRVITVAQPPFLYLICFGSILVSIPLYFYALDETTGLSANQLSGFCIASIWFRYTGYLVVYMSMFCKLLRVYKVMQFRRNQVIKIKHVMCPFVTVMVAIVGLLIAMTVTDPPTWTREVFLVDEDDGAIPPFILEKANHEYGFCRESSSFDFAISLLLIASILISAIMSCKTRHLPPDISDSRRVCQALWCHLILSVLGVVGGVAGFIVGSISVTTLIQVGVEFLSVLAIISLLIFPKMFLVWRDSQASVGGVIHISGLNTRTLATHVQGYSSADVDRSGTPDVSTANRESLNFCDQGHDFDESTFEGNPSSGNVSQPPADEDVSIALEDEENLQQSK